MDFGQRLTEVELRWRQRKTGSQNCHLEGFEKSAAEFVVRKKTAPRGGGAALSKTALGDRTRGCGSFVQLRYHYPCQVRARLRRNNIGRSLVT
jgi:hypothetical protein